MSNRSDNGSNALFVRWSRSRGVSLQKTSGRPSAAAFLLTVLLVFLPGTQAGAQSICKPALTVGNVALSDVVNLKRFWTAVVTVDASKCEIASGLFALGFVRVGNGLDVEFAEPLVWRPGATKVRVEFWADEAVDKYWIDQVAACACRAN